MRYMSQHDWKLSPIEVETGCDKPGIYRVRLFSNGKPVEIGRLGGTDRMGILAIGNSDNIEKRRKLFVRAKKGNHGHSAGIQWYLVTYHSKRFEKCTLMFQFTELVDKKEAEEEEEKEIWEYFKNYLEVPPLNGSIPGREKRFDEIRK
jgi:hypothetical protein